MYVYIMRSNDDREETNSKTSSKGHEEQPTLPAETSSGNSTKSVVLLMIKRRL
jgi:hypothetical protein